MDFHIIFFIEFQLEASQASGGKPKRTRNRMDKVRMVGITTTTTKELEMYMESHTIIIPLEFCRYKYTWGKI